MAYESVKNQIDAYIKANGVNLITGPVLNAVLTTMLDELGEGYAFQGVLNTTDTPSPAADIPQAWLAAAGSYLGGSITVDEDELALIIHTADGWSKETVYRGVQLSHDAILDALGYTPADEADLAEKQDTITDLSAIRSGAALGSTSVQPVDIKDMVKAEPIGSIVPPVNPSEFATKEELSQLEAEVTEFESDVNGRTFLKNLVWTNGYITNTGAINNSSASKFTQPFVLKKGQKVTIGTANSSITIIGTTSSASLSVGDSVTPLQTTGYPETFETHTYIATEDTTIVLCVKWANYTLSFQQTKTMEVEIGNINERLDVVEDAVFETEQNIIAVPLTVYNDGYYLSTNGAFNADNSRRRTEKIDVAEGDKFLVTTKIGSSTVIAYLAQWNGETFVGVASGFTGGSGNASDKEYIVPFGVTKIAICSYDTTAPSLKKVIPVRTTSFYTKAETENEIDLAGKYGVKWSVSDINDLGSRELSAVGKTATIGIGNTDGNSDFDNIWPWAGIKRCNIKSNANGASIVTFEGETGFALDGSNGDVFVRIPKFKTDHYVKDGYEHIVIGDGYVHPAFIEDGEELDEIFIGAFEASGDSSALFSKGGVIPANNITGASFLAGAKARGTKYSLYDMRCVDALWRLMAVEYGCRNSNRIFGWGYANYMQPDNLSHLKVVVAAQNTNTITLAQPTLNSIRVELLQVFASGNNLCICENTQTNIIAQRKIVSVECASLADNVVITFDGDPIDVNTDMFVGNAPCDCNYCETIGDSWKLNWHTGRANRPVLSGIGYVAETCNPCRYRWVENIVGNVWHSLPDVTFKDLQMYVCKNMKDYEMLRYTPPYIPVGAILPEQNSNGYKFDVNTVAQPNYWITGLLLDIFAKGNNFGKSFDTAHDGTITSTKGFGGYYYLYDGTHYIANGGGYDHLWRCNMLTNRAWQSEGTRWYLYGARLMFKNI